MAGTAVRMNIVVHYDNLAFAPEIEYAFCVLSSILGLEFTLRPLKDYDCPLSDSENTLTIYYGDRFLPSAGGKCIYIRPSGFFGRHYLTSASAEPAVLPRTEDDVPIVFAAGSDGSSVFVKRFPQTVETNADIVASSFFFLTRHEEAISGETDAFGRYPVEASLAYRHGLLNRPLVNEYAGLLWSWITHLFGGLVRRTCWQGRDGAFCLTHDVDHLERRYDNRPAAKAFLASWASGHPRRALYHGRVLARRWFGSNPYNTFDYLLSLAKQYGIHSTFYFLVEPQHDIGCCGYPLDGARLAGILRGVATAGCEIGLHAGYNSYADGAGLRKEKRQLVEKAREIGAPFINGLGCRQHFLRWKTPESWTVREEAGFLYDSSLGFAAQAGFRCGMCLPFRPYDIKARRLLNLWEVPLIVMDGTLADEKYMGLTPAEGAETIRSLLETVRHHHGVFTFLWHNSSLDEEEMPGWRQVLANVMQEVSQLNVLRETVSDTLETFRQFGEAAYRRHCSTY